MATNKMYRVMNTHDYKVENKIVHEYTISVTTNNNGHTVTTLSRSLDDVWAENLRGEEVVSIIDTGDMIIFPKKEFAGDVGYDKFAELFILLSFINKTEHLPLYQGDIEEITPGKSFNI
jgi:hypothetical protein